MTATEIKPVSNPSAEAALLGAMMLDNRVIDDAARVLLAGDFFQPHHRQIFELLVMLRQKGQIANPISIRPFLGALEPVYWDRPDGQLEQVDVVTYAAKLTGSATSLIGARDFAIQVRDLAIMRNMAKAALDGAEQLGAPDGLEISVLAADIAGAIAQAAERAAPVKVRSGAQMIRRARDRQIELNQGSAVGAMCKTIPEINTMLGPVGWGTYTIIGGRPSMGKSVLVQSGLLGFALNGHPSLLISQEMGEDGLAMRLTADATHAMNEPVDYSVITSGKMDASEMLTVEEAANRLEKIPLRMVSPDRATVEEIESIAAIEANRLSALGQRLEVLAIDYIQIIRSTKKFSSRVEELNYISHRLMRLFARLKCAGIVLSQISRDVEKRPDHRPQMSDLRESGNLEQDADNVLFVNRPEYWLERSKPDETAKEYENWFRDWQATRGKVDLISAKTRASEISTRRLNFIGSSQAIRSGSWRSPTMGDTEAYL